MPRQQVKKTYFTFVGGLNTEAGFLTFPPNMWKDGDNVIPQWTGALHNRTAVNYEHSFAASDTADTLSVKGAMAYGCFEWDNIGGSGGKNYIVVQRGRYLHFYENVGGVTSGTELADTFTLDLNDFKAISYPRPIGIDLVQCATVNGKLLVCSIGTDPFVVEEVAGDTAFTTTRLTLNFRDFEGVTTDTDLGASVDTQPATLSTDHQYNLMNQGWTDTTISAYFVSQTVYPANSQQWFVGKDADDNFDPALLAKQEFGKGRAPMGRFILSAFRRDRSGVAGIGTIPIEVEAFRPTACAFFAGRAWYAGIPTSEKLGNWIFFSQVGTSISKFQNCYQEADPTSEKQSDLVDNDGGVVGIYGIGGVIKLVPSTNSILIFADNGVWQISGSAAGPFSATGYEVTKVTTIGAVSPQSIVVVDTSILYWSKEGIWNLTPNQMGFYEAKNMSFNNVASLLGDINPIAKEFTSGRYHLEDKKVYWLYDGSANPDGTADRYKKTRMLVLDIRLGAFYTHTIGALASASPYVLDLMITKGKSLTQVPFDVMENTTNLTNLVDSLVVADFETVIGSLTELKFLTQIETTTDAFNYTWSEFEDGTVEAATRYDWYSEDDTGVGWVPFILTGHDLGANQGGDRKLQTNYITILMERMENGWDSSGNLLNPASVLLQSRWNFTDSTMAGKWSSFTQVYRHRRPFLPPSYPWDGDDGQEIVIAKHKMRGRGNAFQLMFKGEIGKDFKLVGWSVPVLSNVD